jgi:hypothetical protein
MWKCFTRSPHIHTLNYKMFECVSDISVVCPHMLPLQRRNLNVHVSVSGKILYFYIHKIRNFQQCLHSCIQCPYNVLIPSGDLQMNYIEWKELSQFWSKSQFNRVTNFPFLVSTWNWDYGLFQFNEYGLTNWIFIWVFSKQLLYYSDLSMIKS